MQSCNGTDPCYLSSSHVGELVILVLVPRVRSIFFFGSSARLHANSNRSATVSPDWRRRTAGGSGWKRVRTRPLCKVRRRRAVGSFGLASWKRAFAWPWSIHPIQRIGQRHRPNRLPARVEGSCSQACSVRGPGWCVIIASPPRLVRQGYGLLPKQQLPPFLFLPKQRPKWYSLLKQKHTSPRANWWRPN